MISGLFFVNQRGDVILSRLYRYVKRLCVKIPLSSRSWRPTAHAMCNVEWHDTFHEEGEGKVYSYMRVIWKAEKGGKMGST